MGRRHELGRSLLLRVQELLCLLLVLVVLGELLLEVLALSVAVEVGGGEGGGCVGRRVGAVEGRGELVLLDEVMLDLLVLMLLQRVGVELERLGRRVLARGLRVRGLRLWLNRGGGAVAILSAPSGLLLGDEDGEELLLG